MLPKIPFNKQTGGGRERSDLGRKSEAFSCVISVCNRGQRPDQLPGEQPHPDHRAAQGITEENSDHEAG